MTEPGAGSAFFRMNGAGENLTWSAADFENFLEPRPDLARTMERDLEKIVELLATNEWPFRIHATSDESIDRFLTVFERVNQQQPLKTRSIIDHVATIWDRTISWVKALAGGTATPPRLTFQREHLVPRNRPDAPTTKPTD